MTGRRYRTGQHRGRRRGACAVANGEEDEPAHEDVVDERSHERRAEALLLLFEEERDLNGVLSFDVNGDVTGGGIRADPAVGGGLCHWERYRATRRGIVPHRC